MECIAATGQFCDCPECQAYNKAYDAIEYKPEGMSGIDALVKDGFSKAEAKKYIDIFDDLGIFTAEELS